MKSVCGALRTFNGDALVVDLGGLGPFLVASVRAPFVAVVREVVLLQPGLVMVRKMVQVVTIRTKDGMLGPKARSRNYCRTSLLAVSSVKAH
jgi:hypothetical protein